MHINLCVLVAVHFPFLSVLPAAFHCACAVQKCCYTRRICALHLLDNDNTMWSVAGAEG